MVTEERVQEPEQEARTKRQPNPKCKDCYGRGYLRWVVKKKVVTRPCHCVKNRKNKNA